MTPITPKPIQDFIPAAKPDILPGERRRPQLIDSFRPATSKPQSSSQPQAPVQAAAQPHPIKTLKTTNIDGIVRQQPHSQAQPAAVPMPHSTPHPITHIEAIAVPVPATSKPIVDVQRPKPHSQAHAHLAPHPALHPQHPETIQPAKPIQPARPAAELQKAGRPWAKPAAQSTAGSIAEPAGKPTAKFDNDEYLVDKVQNKLRRMGKAAVIGIVLATILTVLSLYSLQLGEILIAVYAVVVIFKRIASRYTFMLALAMFGGIIITQLITPDSGISENIAVYAFLLLCVGTLSLAREVRRDSSHSTSSS